MDEIQKKNQETVHIIYPMYRYQNPDDVYAAANSSRSYPELAMRLSLIGVSAPSEETFEMCRRDPWRWRVFCSAVAKAPQGMGPASMSANVRKHLRIRRGERLSQAGGAACQG